LILFTLSFIINTIILAGIKAIPIENTIPPKKELTAPARFLSFYVTSNG